MFGMQVYKTRIVIHIRFMNMSFDVMIKFTIDVS